MYHRDYALKILGSLSKDNQNWVYQLPIYKKGGNQDGTFTITKRANKITFLIYNSTFYGKRMYITKYNSDMKHFLRHYFRKLL